MLKAVLVCVVALEVLQVVSTNSASCHGEPPAAVNGNPVVGSREHGTVVWYRCNDYFKKTKSGRVICDNGTWKGETPVCSDTRCYTSQLNYSCSEMPEREYFRSGEYFEIKCEDGCIMSAKRMTCFDGKWDIQKNPCNLASCQGEPPAIANGKPVVDSRDYGTVVWYRCNDYFKKTKPGRVTCGNGTWKGETPECSDTRCYTSQLNYSGFEMPEREFFRSGENFEIQCEEGYIMSAFKKRMTCFDGKWDIEKNPCNPEVRCDMPKSPDHGSVEIFGDPIAGNLAFYFCDDDTTMEGLPILECLISGNWTFDPPKCLRSCKIPDIENGEVGQYEAQTPYRYSPKEFVKFQVGNSVNHSETVTVRCREGFAPVNDSLENKDRSYEITCNDGEWSKLLKCRERVLCHGEPPAMANGSPVIENRHHGWRIWYRCDKGFYKTKAGRVECIHGTWKGETPVCRDIRCHTDQLKFPGLVKPDEEFLRSGETFEIKCERGYRKSTFRKRMGCMNGDWSIENNLCTIERCEDEPPQILNGRISNFTREHGSVVYYECNEDFEKIGSSTVRCEIDRWEGEPPFCREFGKSGETSSAPEPGRTSTGHSNGVTPTESIDPSAALQVEECFCTYEYPMDIFKATIDKRTFEGENGTEKGETLSLSCLHPDMIMVWPSGLRFSGTVNLPCNTCQHWQYNDFPTCEAYEAGDSLIIYNNNMKLLPGGIIEIPNSKRIEFQCVNSLFQPVWNVGDRKGISFAEDGHHTWTRNGFYSAYMIIAASDDEHSGVYECSALDTYGYYTTAFLNLKIAEPDIQCPELEANTQKGNFTIVYENNRKVNSEAYFSCRDITQKLIGSNVRRCTENGSWSDSYPSCEDVRCPVLEEKDIFLITYSNDRKVHSSAVFYCTNQNQKLIGSRDRKCLPDGQWSAREPTCVDITCPKFTPYNGLVVFYTNDNKVNSTASFHCTEEAILIGSDTSVCQRYGFWSKPMPSCEKSDIQCPELQTNTQEGNFTIVYENNRKINSEAYFSCTDSTQKLIGSNVRRCTENGSWSGSYPSCQDYVSCERFQSSPGLEVLYSDDVRMGSTAAFRCSPPNILLGSSLAICQCSGTWSHDLPSCVEPKCSIQRLVMSILPEGVILDVSEEPEEFQSLGSEVRLQCEDGSVLTGSSKAICGSLGRWEVGNVQCVSGVSGCRVSKDAFPHLLIHPVKEFYRFGEFILLSCPPGFKRTSEIERIMCLDNAWSDDIPNCTELKETSPSGLGETT